MCRALTIIFFTKPAEKLIVISRSKEKSTNRSKSETNQTSHKIETNQAKLQKDSS